MKINHHGNREGNRFLGYLAVIIMPLLAVLASCTPSLTEQAATNKAQNRRLDALEEKVVAQDKELKRLDEVKADIEAPIVHRTPPTKSPNITVPPGKIDAMITKADELSALPNCDAADAYVYIGFDPKADPRVMPDGSEFNFDCRTGYWGWYFDGTPADKYTTLVVDPASMSEHEEYRPLTDLGAPLSRRHPKHSDALTADKLVTNERVCFHGRFDGQSAVVTKVYTYVANFGDTVLVYGAFDVDPTSTIYPVDTPTPNDPKFKPDGLKHSLEDQGVLPYDFGLWADSYLTAGTCQ